MASRESLLLMHRTCLVCGIGRAELIRPILAHSRIVLAAQIRGFPRIALHNSSLPHNVAKLKIRAQT